MRFLDLEIPASMAPLDCLAEFPRIELGHSTLGDELTARWSAVPGVEAVSAAFWPSPALIAKLAACAGGFTLHAADSDRVLAVRSGNDPVSLTPDEESRMIRYPWDILRINEEILSAIRENRIQGTVRENVTLDGIVILGEGSILLPGVYIEGVAVIGKNCKIGPNCYLRGCTFVGDNCHAGQAVELKNSILMHHVAAGHLSYLGDSVICPDVNFGGGTIASNFRHDGKNHRSMVDGVLIDTGRRKFGTVIGSGVHTGIHTSIYPGRKLWAGVSTRPGQVVQRDLTE